MSHRPFPPHGLKYWDAVYLSPQQDVFVAQCTPYASKRVNITRNGQPYDAVWCAHRIYRVIVSIIDPVMVFRSRTATFWYDLFTKELWKLPVRSNFYKVWFSPWHRWVIFAYDNHFSVYDTWNRSVYTLPLPEGLRHPFVLCRFSTPDEVIFLIYNHHYMVCDLSRGHMTSPESLPLSHSCIGPLVNTRQLLLYNNHQLWCHSLTRKRRKTSRPHLSWDVDTLCSSTLDWSPDGRTLYLSSEKDYHHHKFTLLTLDGICTTFTLPGKNYIRPQGILTHDDHQWTIHPWICVQPYQDVLNEHLPTVLCQLVLSYRFPVYFCQHPQVLFPDL